MVLKTIGTILAIILQFLPTTSPSIMASNRVVEVENVMPCENNNQLESPMRNVKFLRLNRTHKSLSYDIEFRRPIDEKIGGSAEIERWGIAGWVSMPFLPFQPDICHFLLRYFRGSFVVYNKALGVKKPDECPIPPGNYSMRNYMIDFSSTRFPIWKGKLRVIFRYQLSELKKTIFCSIHLVNTKEMM